MPTRDMIASPSAPQRSNAASAPVLRVLSQLGKGESEVWLEDETGAGKTKIMGVRDRTQNASANATSGSDPLLTPPPLDTQGEARDPRRASVEA